MIRRPWHELDKAHLKRLWRWGIRDDEELSRRLGHPVTSIRNMRRGLGFLKDVA